MAAVAALLAVLVAWWAGRLSSAPVPAAAASTSAPSVTGAPPPAVPATATPASTADHRKSALAAAARAVALIGSPHLLSADGRAWLVQVLAAPAHRPQLRALLEREAAAPSMVALRDDAERGVRYGLRAVPVALRAERLEARRATVTVFAALYLAGSAQPATLGHGLARVELTWTAVGWQVRSYRSSAAIGPIPAGYTPPDGGWQPVNGDNVILLSEQLRELLSDSVAPDYAPS
ncbi:hypothetical protein [Planomonospora parontospora]|uniref:hypothetical protein n=1 Tax=Planomonospora parontospora TaxID=58119 RepID=UPI00167022E8|nr:hypothetical protein [Planomonospora parontospora]